MKFSIITPTYKRPEQLKRVLTSVIKQSVTNWELIVVNDNPGDDTKKIIDSLADNRIVFLENIKNEGVNKSRNLGLDNIAKDSNWVIFLDDDDYLANDALEVITEIINRKASAWIVTARGVSSDKPSTLAPNSHKNYSYFWDYLIFRRFRGDATHCIKAEFIRGESAKLRFPKLITQGEEWLFYSELGTYTNFYFENIVTTLTDGYQNSGLNFRRRSFSKQMQTIPMIIKDARGRNLYHLPAFWLYLMMRFIRAFIK